MEFLFSPRDNAQVAARWPAAREGSPREQPPSSAASQQPGTQNQHRHSSTEGQLQRINITDIRDSIRHRLTKIWPTQPLPTLSAVCCTTYLSIHFLEIAYFYFLRTFRLGWRIAALVGKEVVLEWEARTLNCIFQFNRIMAHLVASGKPNLLIPGLNCCHLFKVNFHY